MNLIAVAACSVLRSQFCGGMSLHVDGEDATATDVIGGSQEEFLSDIMRYCAKNQSVFLLSDDSDASISIA